MNARGTALAFLVALMSVVFPQIASGKDLCLTTVGVTLVGVNVGIPSKGTCKPWPGFVVDQPDNILTGVICTTSDGTEFQANQYTSTQGELLKWVISLPAGTGTVVDCDISGCSSALSASVVKCPTKPVIPDASIATTTSTLTLVK
jgi:hypothetical protein